MLAAKQAFSGAMFLLVVLGAMATSGASEVEGAWQTSIVSQTDTGHGWAVNYPKQRKVFVMAGRLWVFYSDGRDAGFRSSTDALHWSEPTRFGDGGHFGHRFGGAYDGTSFHYALCTASLGGPVRYRKGTPSADGAIHWLAEEQTAYATPQDKNVMYPKIVVDSAGFPWITFMELVYQEPNRPPFDAVVIKSSTNDGQWSMTQDFPYKLVEQKAVDGYPDPVGAALNDGKTFWLYNTHIDGQDVFASRIWDGAGWQEEEIVASPASIYSLFNAVAVGDDVHVVRGDGGIRYRKRNWASGWDETVLVEANASGHPAITANGADSVLVSWLDHSANRVAWRALHAGVWDETTGYIDESAEGLPGAAINLNSLVQTTETFRQAIVYTVGSSPPYTVKAAVRLGNE